MVSEDHLLLPNFPCQSKSLPDTGLKPVKDRKSHILLDMLDQAPAQWDMVMAMSVSRQSEPVGILAAINAEIIFGRSVSMRKTVHMRKLTGSTSSQPVSLQSRSQSTSAETHSGRKANMRVIEQDVLSGNQTKAGELSRYGLKENQLNKSIR